MAPPIKDSFIDLERHRQLLEDNIERLRKTLRHWQTWEAEYEGLKEEILSAPPNLTREQLVNIARAYEGDLVNEKEVGEIIGQTTSKSTEQVVNLLDRRIDYVQQNVQTVEKQLEAAEHKLAVATVISTPEVRNEEGLPMTEIIEELDDEGNIISSRTSTPGTAKQQLLEVLEKAGVKDLPVSLTTAETMGDADVAKEHNETTPAAMESVKKEVKFADDTKPGPDVKKSQTTKRIEEIMSMAKAQEAPWSKPPIIPTDESPEDAALRREMLQYGMSEVGAVVAELDLEDDSDWTDEEDYDDDDDDEDSFGRSTGKVVDDELRQQMIELEQRLGLRMMENVGKKPDDYVPVEEGIGRITIKGGETADQPKDILTDTEPTGEKLSASSKVQPSDSAMSTKKSVRFSEDLDISPAPPAGAVQAPNVPTARHSVAPVSDIVERKAPEQFVSSTPKKKTSRFKSSRSPVAQVLNGPLAGSSLSQKGPLLSLQPAKPSTPKPFSTSIQFTPMADRTREVPTGPEGKTLSTTVVERDTPLIASAAEPDELDPHLVHQEVATEYHKMRNRMIQRQGGFLEKEESEIVPLTEEEGGPKKMSRFKAARLARS